MKSYSSESTSLRSLLREAQNLYTSRSHGIAERVNSTLQNLRQMESLFLERYGIALHHLDVLDLGAGQFLIQMAYFARHNRVVGVDLDVITTGVAPVQYFRMWRANGSWRTVKTMARKLLGIDRRYRSELRRHLALESWPDLKVHQMDACKMTFPSASFDFIFSYSVFHHLPDPEAAIKHVQRVLRPGGATYLSFHLYTSETGSLDPRVFTSRRSEVLPWGHLRPQDASQVMANAYLNKLRLSAWHRLFAQSMPGAEIILGANARPGAEVDAQALLCQPAFSGYTLEELLTDEVIVIWRKPAHTGV